MSVTAMSTLKTRRLKTHEVHVCVTATHALSALSEAQMKLSLNSACDIDLLKRSRGW